jgi:hypothetical protein
MSETDILDFLTKDSPAPAAQSTDKAETKTQPSGDEITFEEPSDEEQEEDEEETRETSDSDEEAEPDENEEKKLTLDDDEDVEITAPNRAKILKEFPELFKKFPTIEKAIYREQQYAEVFPHPKDAQEAKQSIKILGTIESELGQGNIENLLSSVKKFDEKAFNQITENFLPTIQKLNPKAYFDTINFVLKSAIHQASEFGKNADKESDQYQVALAAKILNRWIYNETSEIRAPKEIGSGKVEASPKERELEERERNFHQTALTTSVKEVDDRIISTLTRSIESAIDPKNLMTPYIKGKATKDVLDQFRADLRKDKRFTANLDRLWVAARDDNYSEAAKTKIREAIKKQAKEVLPDIMRRVKADALKDYRKVAGVERKIERPLERRRPSASNSSSSKSNGKFQLPAGKTAAEFLLED